jgi:hypothetical protein
MRLPCYLPTVTTTALAPSLAAALRIRTDRLNPCTGLRPLPPDLTRPAFHRAAEVRRIGLVVWGMGGENRKHAAADKKVEEKEEGEKGRRNTKNAEIGEPGDLQEDQAGVRWQT